MTTDTTETVEETTDETVEETTDGTVNTESADYKAGYEAGRKALEEEVNASDREVTKLYGLDSYSMLSDSEVRKLIDFNLEVYKMSDTATQLKSQTQAATEAMETANANFCIDARNVLQSIIDSKTNYEGVEPESVTSYLETVQEV